MTSHPPLDDVTSVEITRSYGLTEWREDLKKVLLQVGGCWMHPRAVKQAAKASSVAAGTSTTQHAALAFLE
jgi:hypothetical protein